MVGPNPQTVSSRREISPSSSMQSSSSPNSNSGAPPTAPAAPQPLDQKTLVDAALKMIAEDMLPLSFVEGPGFRTFLNTIKPGYNKLTQRAMGMQLHNEVERTIKPRLIRDLKARTKDGGKAIHVTYDLWAGHESQPVQEPIVVVQLHFVSESWQICRPIVAFRHLSRKDICSAVATELEGVLLSYGVFPQSIGYILTNHAKETLVGNKMFCDYKIMCSSGRADNEDEMEAFLSDQMSEMGSAFLELQFGNLTTCVGKTLQLVIKEALNNSRVVENLLSQVHNIIAFFRSNVYWSEILLTEFNVSLCPPSTYCRWNSMMLSLRRLVQEFAWCSTMSLLTQARVEATDTACIPPLVMVKRQQLVDILGLLEPFEEALQVLQGNSVTISLVIPSLIGLDKILESCVTNYTHFRKALRTGLHKHFQSLLHEEDMILAAVLDPRIKLQPFPDATLDNKTGFLAPPTKQQVHAIVEAAVASVGASASGSEEDVQHQTDKEIKTEPVEEDENQANDLSEPSDFIADEMNEDCESQNDLKRKSIFNFLQPPAKIMKKSEVDVYLAEPPPLSNFCLLYWKSATQLPRLQRIAKRLLAVPATAGGFDRLCPMAACIVKAKRNHLPAHTTERLLLYKDAVMTKPVQKPSH